ncbi:MAG: FAD-binding protein, partial [Myxococcota bacterium]|nr:FAD-binding protein [Myxococcota bacterium]
MTDARSLDAAQALAHVSGCTVDRVDQTTMVRLKNADALDAFICWASSVHASWRFTSAQSSFVDSTLAIDLSQFDQVVSRSSDGRHVEIQSGMTWATVEAKLAVDDLSLGPIPAWLGACSVAQTFHDSAMIRPSPHYGTLMDAVLGVEYAVGSGRMRGAP